MTGVTNFVDGPPPGQNSILTSFTRHPPTVGGVADLSDSVAIAGKGAIARIGAHTF